MKKRIIYALLFIAFLGIEFAIALFVHDSFVRPYVGDMLVVIVIYFLVKTVFTKPNRLLPLYIFVFAALVEVAQFLNIPALLGIGKNTAFGIAVGSVFDVKDIFCYLAGCLCLFVIEAIMYKRHNKNAEG